MELMHGTMANVVVPHIRARCAQPRRSCRSGDDGVDVLYRDVVPTTDADARDGADPRRST